MKLLNGDCLELMKNIEDKSIDCIVTSPPYWKGFEYEAYFNSYKQYLDWCLEWMRECKRVLKPTGTFYLNVSNDSETTIRAFELMEIATKELMFKLHDTIIWYRYNQQPAPLRGIARKPHGLWRGRLSMLRRRHPRGSCVCM